MQKRRISAYKVHQHCFVIVCRYLEKTHVCLFVCSKATSPLFIAVQPELTGSRSKHSETITSGPSKMNHTFVLLSADFIGAIKVFINLQNHSEHFKGFLQLNMSALEGLCSVWMPSNLLPVLWKLDRWAVYTASDLRGQIKTRKWTLNYGSYARVFMHFFWSLYCFKGKHLLTHMPFDRSPQWKLNLKKSGPAYGLLMV